MYLKDPMAIENRSMDIIEEVMKDTSFSQQEKIIVKRMIHTTGDFEYRKIVDFRNDFVSRALQHRRRSNIYRQQDGLHGDK